MRVDTWAQLASLLSSGLSDEDVEGGWSERLRREWLASAESFANVGMRFKPSDARGIIRALMHGGVTSGPILDALAAAERGIPGVGTTEAVAECVKLLVSRTRQLGFAGRGPTLRRELGDETAQLINFQRMNSGVTGREPSFTVNLNIVHGAVRRALAAAGHWLADRHPIPSGASVGVFERLGILVHGRDEWYHPSTSAEAMSVAETVFEQLRNVGLGWLDRLTQPDTAIDELLGDGSLDHILVAPALLVERPGDERRGRAIEVLAGWRPAAGTDEHRLREWLIQQLLTTREVIPDSRGG